MTNLTEQYKKGELEQGWYYVKNEFGNIFISEYSKDYDFIGERVISGFFTEVSDITEIICKVPSYEQYRTLQKMWVDELDRATRFQKALDDVCEEYNQKLPILEEENQKLKELLIDFTKRIEHYKEVKPDVGFIMYDLGYLANQVKEVLK